jgi:hypothetical protein
VAVAHGSAKKRKEIVEAGAEFVVVNFDGVGIIKKQIMDGGFDLIVVDEASAYKNAQTVRWKDLRDLTRAVKGLWMLTGTPAAPTASAGNNSTQISTTAYVDAAITAVKAALFPVGAIYTAVVSTNPGTLLGFGTWTAFGAGRVMVGYDASNALFDTAEETGGSADAITVSHTHTATVTDSGHRHKLAADVAISSVFPNTTVTSSNQIAANAWASNSESYIFAGSSTDATIGRSSNETTGISVSNSTTGSSGTNANYQPYITVYMWKRTA